MRILLHGINFSPELTGIGKYTGDMAEWLAARGHAVRVVTAPPYYPAWRVGAGYRAWAWRRERRDFEGGGSLDVWRCPLWVPRRPGGLARLLHLASFALASLPVMLASAAWRPRRVWVVEPALMCAPQALLLARLCGARAWLHIQDFEVDAAFELGLLRGARKRAWVERIEGWLMRRFDSVSSISARMVERCVAKGVDAARARLFPNWVDLDAITPAAQSRGNALRAELGLADDTVVALYSGNMGAKQGLEVLAAAAAGLELAAPDLVFVLCGEGSARQMLIDQCANLSNVRFLPLQPLERLSELLTMADIHLLPQRADAADLVMPSKLTGMLASARPVVAGAHPGTALADVVAGCGVVVAPEDGAAMAAAIAALAADPARRRALGGAGREHARQHLDRASVLARFEQDLCA
jgi:colanic acid biosynthesis glycosyl transferase WcaI